MIFTKIWTWIKEHWKAIAICFVLLLIGIVTLSIFRKNGFKNIINTFKTAKESYEKQIAVIEFENNKEKVLKEKVNSEYENIKIELKKKHNIEIDNLKKKQKKELKDKIKKFGDDKDGQMKEIAKEYNIEVYNKQ